MGKLKWEEPTTKVFPKYKSGRYTIEPIHTDDDSTNYRLSFDSDSGLSTNTILCKKLETAKAIAELIESE
jgi:hypothetical protein